MAAVHELGLESTLLDAVLLGDKRIEGRLNRGKFNTFQVGDRLRLRRDLYRNGEIIGEIRDQAEVQIARITEYTSFAEMLNDVGFHLAVPGASTIEDAIAEYSVYYPLESQTEYGVRAFHLILIWPIL